jgi:hypothetical protein
METTRMSGWIAKRDLVYSLRGCAERFDLSVLVYAPFELIEGSVNFKFHPGIAGCIVETSGFPQDVSETFYGTAVSTLKRNTPTERSGPGDVA